MAKVENEYCRFCAEPKSVDKLLNLQKDEKKFDEILKKLDFLNAMYVDLSSKDSILPKTLCLICYDSLNKTYEFLTKVKDAQSVLLNIFPLIDNDVSDDDLNAFDDYLCPDSETLSKPDVKQEIIIDLQKPVLNVENSSLDLKKEPKDEFEDTLNVEFLLDTAFSNVTYQEVPVFVNDLSKLAKRSVSKWKEYPWICAHCDIEFLDVVTLRLHAKITHGKCNAFVCIDCKNFGSGDFESFVDHVRIHRRKLRKRCQYCEKQVAEEDLTSHIREHFQKEQLPCNLCGEILKNNEQLQKHLSEYESAKPKRKPRRKRGTPITIDELTCNLCKKVYKNLNSLRDHIKLHNSDRKRNYTCDRCGKMFYNKGTLTSHIMAHQQIRPHICRICNKSFLFPNMLRRHVEMHSGVKPFSCEQCGRCFRLQYQLNAHKIIHTDSMPHVCQFCNKAFRFKQILNNHERQHTGAKPYACQNCGMKFTNWSNYNKHMKRRHNLDLSKKKITPEGVFPINPQTGQLVQMNDAGTEEWKTKIMIPGKRGKKKGIKMVSS